MPPIIEVQNLSKRYRLGKVGATTLRDDLGRIWGQIRGTANSVEKGEFWALRDVSFNIEAGEVVGIIGRNGAGKSTLLKILSRITEPTSGRAVLRGRVASLLEVGTGFHPDLTGRENVFLNGTILGMKHAEIARRFDEIVGFAGIPHFIDTPVKHYSSGMRVRLAFAVAAHLQAEVLIIDEVLAVGDADFQKQCLAKMDQVAGEGRTIIFVSHNAAAIRELCTRGIYLQEGKVSYDANVSEALQRYQTQFHRPTGSSWIRPADRPAQALAVQSVQITLSGDQPNHELAIAVTLACRESTRPCLIAVDIRDELGIPVLQIMPKAAPFIEGSPGEHQLTIWAELPPLIPGIYVADIWLGQHHTTTADHVRGCVMFEIGVSPSAGRTFPHSADHGFIALPSQWTYIAADGSEHPSPA